MTAKELLMLANSNTQVHFCGSWTGSVEDLKAFNMPVSTAIYENDTLKIFFNERRDHEETE